MGSGRTESAEGPLGVRTLTDGPFLALDECRVEPELGELLRQGERQGCDSGQVEIDVCQEPSEDDQLRELKNVDDMTQMLLSTARSNTPPPAM